MVVLLYHRVVDSWSDPFALSVSLHHFAEHLDLVSRRFHLMSLRSLEAHLSEGRVPDRSVVLTFDDGYADNLYNAMPLLERHGAPATVFTVTGGLDGGLMFWWDELHTMLLLSPRLPAELRLTVGGTDHRWPLGEWAEVGEVGDHTYPDDQTPRHRALRLLNRLLRTLDARGREAALDALRSQIGTLFAPHPRMTTEELVRLTRGGLVELGAHTTTHTMLSACEPDEQRREIVTSRRAVENITGRPVGAFAYPFGRRAEVGEHAVGLVREAGFGVACSSERAVVDGSTDRWWIPRLTVADWDGDELERQLDSLRGDTQ